MKKVLALTFVTFPIAALVTSVVMMGTPQTANAQGKSGSAFGKNVIRPEGGGGPPWGDDADLPHENDGFNGQGHGLGDERANGCKQGQGDTGNPCS